MAYRGTKDWFSGKRNASEIMSCCSNSPKQKPMRLLTRPKVPMLDLSHQRATSSVANQQGTLEAGHLTVSQKAPEENLMKEVVEEVADWLGREVEGGLLIPSSTEIQKSDCTGSSAGTALKP